MVPPRNGSKQERSAISQFLTFLHHFVCATANSHAPLKADIPELVSVCARGPTDRISPFGPGRAPPSLLCSRDRTCSGHEWLPPTPAVTAPQKYPQLQLLCCILERVNASHPQPSPGQGLTCRSRLATTLGPRCFSHPILLALQHQDEPKGSGSTTGCSVTGPNSPTPLPAPPHHPAWLLENNVKQIKNIKKGKAAGPGEARCSWGAVFKAKLKRKSG